MQAPPLFRRFAVHVSWPSTLWLILAIGLFLRLLGACSANLVFDERAHLALDPDHRPGIELMEVVRVEQTRDAPPRGTQPQDDRSLP